MTPKSSAPLKNVEEGDDVEAITTGCATLQPQQNRAVSAFKLSRFPRRPRNFGLNKLRFGLCTFQFSMQATAGS
jgi:hypothetical protein